MASQADIAERLISALGKEIKRDPSTIQASHRLRDDLGLNSLDAIELMFKVEEEFDIAIPDADLVKLVTVGDLVTYIDGRLNNPTATAAPARPATSKSAPAAARLVSRSKAKPAASKPKPTKKAASPKGRRRHA
jgi:acyl carrier protein